MSLGISDFVPIITQNLLGFPTKRTEKLPTEHAKIGGYFKKVLKNNRRLWVDLKWFFLRNIFEDFFLDAMEKAEDSRSKAEGHRRITPF